MSDIERGNRPDLLCEDCGHHLHRPNPGQCQWYECSCGPTPSTRSTGSEGAEAPDPVPRSLLVSADCQKAAEDAYRMGLEDGVGIGRAAPPSAPDPERALCPGNCLKQHAHYYAHPDPEGLPSVDVERLGEAMRLSGIAESYDGNPWNPATLRRIADFIAAEYERLSAQATPKNSPKN